MSPKPEYPRMLDQEEREEKPTPGLLSQEYKANLYAGAQGALRNASLPPLLHSAWELLKPEFLSKRKFAGRVGPTAWLDGLRGAAALLVCIMHLTVYTHNEIEICYGAMTGSGKPNNSFAALPIIRLPFTGGHFSVCLFFVISGYVVPRRLISLLHEGRKEEFLEALNSAMFRRPGRLFLPVMWSTLFLAVVMGHLIPIDVPFPFYKDTLFLEIYNWVKEMGVFANFYRTGPLFTWYNFHTWTIPVELRGSMLLFVWLFAVHTIKTRARVIMTACFLYYMIFWTPSGWYSCFFAGMLTGELDMLTAAGNPVPLPWDPIARFFRKREPLRQVVLHITLLAGLYFGSQPANDNGGRENVLANCPGWKTLNHWIPDAYGDGPPGNVNYRWYWFFWAAWMTLLAVKEINWVRAIFETGPAQYLGRHSFALYLIHGPMIGLLSERLFYLTGVKTPVDLASFVRYGKLQNKWHDAAWWPFPDGGPTAFEPNFLFCVAISMPIFMYVAEIGTKVFDQPSVTATSWLWKKVKLLR